jgi:hypothetical protein
MMYMQNMNGILLVEREIKAVQRHTNDAARVMDLQSNLVTLAESL